MADDDRFIPDDEPFVPDEKGSDSWGHTAKDVGKQLLAGPVVGLEGIASAPAQLMGLAGKGLQYLGIGNEGAAGEQEKLKNLIAQNRGEGIVQYLPKPETTAGKYARTVGEMVPAGVAQPGSILRRGAEAVGAGLASEGAGQLTEGTELEPYARAAGALVGAYPIAKAAQIGQDVRRAIATPTVTELHDASDAAYKAARGLKVQYDEHATHALERNIQRDLLIEGYRPGPGMSVFDRIEELTAAPQTKNPTFSDIEGVRKALNKIAGERNPHPPFGPTSNASAAFRAIDHIDDFLADASNAAPGFQGAAKRAAMLAEEGRGNWAAKARSQTIEQAAEKGELSAAAAGSGANIENRLRSEIKNILNNPRRVRGFSPEDRVVMRDMVKGDFGRNSARLLGKMAMTGIVSAGGVQYLASTLGLGALGHVFLPVAGHISKKVGDISMRHAYRNLAANLRAGSPLGHTRNIPDIGLPPSGKAALLRSAIAGETTSEPDEGQATGGRIDSASGFRKGGRVTKTFRYSG